MKTCFHILAFVSLASLAEPARPAAPASKPTAAKPATPAKPVVPPPAKPATPAVKPVVPPVPPVPVVPVAPLPPPVAIPHSPWSVNQAPLRAWVAITEPAALPAAGVLALLPDGGLLGTPWAVPEVYDSAGGKLESTIVWHNPREGMGVAFMPPEDGRGAWIYLVPSTAVPPRLQTRLRPGLLLYARNLPSATLGDAVAMAGEWPPGRNAVMRPVAQIGHRENPFGLDDQYSCWYTGWFRLEKPADIFFATISDDGSEIRLNGETLVAWPGVHGRQEGAKGQFGKKVAIAVPWNRLDYLYFNGDGDRETNCLWRRSGPDKAFPTTITDKELSRSGRSRLDAIEFQDGRTAAQINGTTAALGYFWYGDKPLLLFQLTAETAGAPAKTTWDWTFARLTGEGEVKKEDSGHYSGPTCLWLQRGETGGVVTLSATTGGQQTHSTRALTAWSTAPAWNPWDPAQRNAFFAAFKTMGEAKTNGGEPAATWTAEYWETLLGLLEFERRGELLETLFTHNPKTLQNQADSLRIRLQMAFIEALLDRSGAISTLAWIDKFAGPDAAIADRQFFWQNQRVRAWLWKESNLAEARKMAADLRGKAKTPEQLRRALIRQGDVERLAKDDSAALKFYDEAQELARPQDPAGRKGRQARVRANQPEDAAWKAKTIRQGSYPATIRSLLAQKAIDEAGAKLAEWEMELPLDKLGGDQPLLEALWLEARWQPWAACRLLEAVRNREASTRNLPEMMVAEIRMLMAQQRTAEAVKLGDELFRKYPTHALVAEARRLLPLPVR